MIKKQLKNRGFTLVEILIVVALIAILAVIALITINPAEANKRARDAQRLKEIGTIMGVIQQYLDDNLATATTAVTADSDNSSGSTNCDTSGWHGLALCAYANQVPRDPMNRNGDYVLTDGTVTEGDITYQINIDDAARYRICTRLESKSNSGRLTADNVSNNYFEAYSSTDAPACSN